MLNQDFPQTETAPTTRLAAEAVAEVAATTAGTTAAEAAAVRQLLHAAEVLATERELATLLAALLQRSLRQARATRSCLLLEHGTALFLHAEAKNEAGNEAGADSFTFHEAAGLPLSKAPNLPAGLIEQVWRTGQPLVLAAAAQAATFAADPYLRSAALHAVGALPIFQQGRLLGVLYLESAEPAAAFVLENLRLSQLFAAQAAQVLSNARLYAEMKAEVAQRRLAETTLRSIMEGTAALTGGDFFASLVPHLARAIPVKIAFVTECANLDRTRARILAFWDGKGLVDSFEYDVRKTTCEKVYEGETCFYASELQRLFPEETALVDLNGQSYIGLPLRDAAGELIGHLAVIDDQPMDAPRGLGILKIFAARAGAELERMRAENELRQALAEIERLKNQLHAENIYLQEEIRREHNFDEIVGNSPALLAVLQQVERIAPTDATVLILGETGTGKELIARAIHDRSPRQRRPLVKVNCGAISAGLVESELFGHVKGAFTGALDKRTGRFELADGGTLFLDEVGELPLDTQVKLLRVLQEGEFEPVGSSRTLKVDVRIIAATNRNLAAEVSAGRFRADLFYRLNVLPLHNPPLRERRTDIPQLAMFFLERAARRFGRQFDRIAPETLELLLRYHWPGNIRELQNLIERGVVLAQGPALKLEPGLLAPVAAWWPSAAAPGAGGWVAPVAVAAPLPPPPGAPTSLAELQRQHILHALTQSNWVIEGERGAAKILNLHPNTLRSRLKKMGLRRPTATAASADGAAGSAT